MPLRKKTTLNHKIMTLEIIFIKSLTRFWELFAIVWILQWEIHHTRIDFLSKI